MSNVNNLEKIVNDFFEELQEAYNSGCLTIKKTKKIVNDSNLSKDWKKDIISRIEEHKTCEKEMLEEDEEFSFVVSNYADVNLALECECCYSVVIDDEIMLSEEEE